MKRLQWIILKNFWRIPGLMIRLNRRIRSPENYTDEERLEPIQYFCRKVQENGNISVELSGQENIPKERLVKSGCTTNIHYVVSKDTINEAITRLEMDLFPKGVNAVVFILYKPVGNGIIEKVLKNTDSRIERFISLATKVKHPYRVGFDTCFTPALLRWGDTVPAVSIDACEAATFSMYIDSQMNCYPCSFGIWDKNISESMNSKTLREIWRGDKFVAFREQRKVKCSSCRQMELCQGGCRLGIDIDMC